MIEKSIIIGSLALAMAGNSLSQTGATPPATTTPAPGNTIHVVSYSSTLSTLNLNQQTVGLRGTGNAVTTMRLERNASGQLVHATIMVRIDSESARSETFNQIQIGDKAGPVVTLPVTGAPLTVPGQDSRTIHQSEISDAGSLAQIERFLRDPTSFTLTVGTASNPGGVLSGRVEVDRQTAASRSDARLKTIGSLDRAIYRLVVLMAYKDGTITPSERDSLMEDLAVFTRELSDAGYAGSGMAVSMPAATTTTNTSTNP